MFFVIEGIDGAGCETQANLVTKKLKEQSKNVTLIKFPHYDTRVGKMIRDFLYENKNLTKEEQFLLYSLQFVSDKDMILDKQKDSIVIADRYFTTTLCYQILAGISEDTALRFAEDFGIIKPDSVFFLNVSPEIARKRKFGEDKELNFMEKDFKLMQSTNQRYQDMLSQQVWTNWQDINGEGTPDEVADSIVSEILNKI